MEQKNVRRRVPPSSFVFAKRVGAWGEKQ